MDKYRNQETDGANYTRRDTLRERLESIISLNELQVKRCEENINEAKAALLVLKKNSELETLLNLLEK